MVDLQQIVDEMTHTLNLKGEGADEERARILWYLRRGLEHKCEEDADLLNGMADAIEAGFHWDMTEEEEAALSSELAAEG